MYASDGSYINGYIQRKSGGTYEGDISIEGISLAPIVGVFFKQDGKNYLWLRRKDILEYDFEQQQYRNRKREPRWEAYLEKQMSDNSVVAYRGEFYFMRFKFSIEGVWDAVCGMDNSRINFYIERLPMNQQDIINGITNRNKDDK